MNIQNIAIAHYNEYCTNLNPLIERAAKQYQISVALLERAAVAVPEISRDSRLAKLRRVYFQKALPLDETAAAGERAKCYDGCCSFLECIENRLSVLRTYQNILDFACRLFEKTLPEFEREVALERAKQPNRLWDCIKPLIDYSDWLRRVTVYLAVCMREPLSWSKRIDAEHLRRSFEKNLYLRDNVMNAMSLSRKERDIDDREITISLILQLT